MPKEWEGSVFPYRGKLYVQFKDPKRGGKFSKRATPYKPGQEAEAEKVLASIREQLAAQADYLAAGSGEVTVQSYGEQWLKGRQHQSSWRDDQGRLREHVYPEIGIMPLANIRARHMLQLVRALTVKRVRVQGSGERGRIAGEKALAPRTIRNVYSVCSALFRDAATEGLIEQTPCILSRAQLPKVKDADPTWRATAIFLPAEVESLISDERIPQDRRVCYALYFLGCTRFGEMSALHWRAYDPNRTPLASLRVELSYNTRAKQEKGVKTDNPRTVPVHPTLARILGEWKLSGWSQMFNDKKPQPDDLIVPSRLGKNRSANHMLKRFHEDCARLTSATQPEGLRVRRQHDSRRTFVSLALANGADRESVKWIAHGRPTDVLGMYTESDWRRLCDAVLCVRVRERRVAKVATVRGATNPTGRVTTAAGENGKDLLPSTPMAAKGSQIRA